MRLHFSARRMKTKAWGSTRFRNQRNIAVISLCLFFTSFGGLHAKDIFSNLFENSIATFGDAAEMLYRSFNVVEMSKNRKRRAMLEKRAAEQEHSANSEEMLAFLKAKGIQVSLLGQPMAKKDFAKLLFQRFPSLPRSFLTKSLGFGSLYFQDAKELKIFSQSEAAEETLTAKHMLSSFLKASRLVRSFHIK